MASAELAKVQNLLVTTGDFEQARRVAEEVLQDARLKKDAKVTVDALRSIALCERCRGSHPRYKESSQRKSIYVEAEKLCRDELPELRSQNDLRGEAIMVLSAVEMLLESRRLPETRRGNKKRLEARQSVEKALGTFQDLQEKCWEAEANLVLSSTSLAQNDPLEALRFAQQSKQLFEELNSSELPRALNACAVAISFGPSSKECFEQGLRYHQQAVEQYRRLGWKRELAVQCHALSKWMLQMDKGRDALHSAKESLQMFTELGLADWRLAALHHLCRVCLSLADIKGARKIAQEAEKCREQPHLQLMGIEIKVMLNLELDTMYECGNLDEAFGASKEGLELCRSLQDKKWEAAMHHSLSQVCIRLRRVDEALEAVTSSSTTLDDVGDQSQRCVVLQTAIEILMVKGDARAALEVAQEIRRLAKDLGKSSKEANAMLTEAQIYHSIGNANQALTLARDAQVIFQQVADKKGEGMSWSVIAEIQKSTGEKEDALRACRSTRALYQQAGDKRSQAYAMKSSTALFVANASDEEAVREAHEALALARAAGDAKAEVEMLNLVAQATLNSIIKRSQEMSDEDAINYITLHEDHAVRPAREAAAMARKMGDKQMTGIAMYSVAQCHAVAGRTGAAVQAATEARNLFSETWDRQGEAMAILMLGESLVLDGDTEEGKLRSQEARDLFASLDDHDGVDKAERTLQQIQEILGAPVTKPPTPKPTSPTPQAESMSVVQKKPAMSLTEATELAKRVAEEAIGGDDPITLDDALMDIGLDSLASVSFRDTLVRQSGLNLPSTMMFDYPNLASIATFMVEQSST